MNAEFLKNIKIGDKVGLHNSYHGLSIENVIKLTKTLIVTDNGRYNRNSGRKVGDNGWHNPYLCEVTDEFMLNFNRQRYTNYIKNFVSNGKLKLLTVIELAEVYIILKDNLDKEKNRRKK